MKKYKMERTLDEIRVKDLNKSIRMSKVDNALNLVIPTITGVGTICGINEFVDYPDPSYLVGASFFGAITIFASIYVHNSNKKNRAYIKDCENRIKKLK